MTRRTIRTTHKLLMLAIAFVSAAGGREAYAEASTDTSHTSVPAIIIIDGSGSMWGTLPGERATKIDLARTALRQALAPLGTASRFGLVSFGHRRRADCSDVETILPIERGPGERIASSIDKLNPRGKGPLTLAVREAAKQLPSDGPATIILLHDGPDNCQQDPCAAANEIAESNPKLAIHVISIGLDAADARRMSCVPKTTKGRHFEVRDAADLATAVAEALRLANLDPALGTSSAGDAATRAPVQAEAPGLRLTAGLAGVGPALTVPVTWRVSRKSTPGDVIATRKAPELNLNLPPGSYEVEASLGLAKARRTIEVETKGRTTAQLGLGAGILKIKARADKNGMALSEPVITVARIEKGVSRDTESPRRVPVWISRDPDAEIVLPAAVYAVRVEDGLARRETELSVTPGNTIEAPFVLGTGRLELSAANYGGAEAVTDVVFALSEDDPDSPAGRRDVARSADPRPVFVLPAGTYYITARSGFSEVRDRVAVSSGATVKHLLTFNAVKLAITVDLDGAAPERQPVTVRVLGLDPGEGEIARSLSATPEFLLPPRRYRIEARLGTQNVMAATDVELPPGKDTTISFRLQSGELIVVPATGAATPWQVKDEKGRTVLHSGAGGQRIARLAPGRYILQSERNDRVLEQHFELKAGEKKTLAVASQ